MAKPANVISDWSQLTENFQASSQDFFTAFEHGVGARAVPELHSARVEHRQQDRLPDSLFTKFLFGRRQQLELRFDFPTKG